MPAKLHKDVQSDWFDDAEFTLQLAGIGASENFPPLISATSYCGWPVIEAGYGARRNSTSSISPTSTSRSRMNMNSLTSMASAIPETGTATISAAVNSIPAIEGKFRGRAFSEGASSLCFEPPPSPPQQQPSSRYKTELCRPYEENGKCKYGDKCQFAHGRHELRQLIRHPKYKTELCRTFHTTGFCPYGPRCHFIHNQDDSANRANALQAAANLGTMGRGTPVAVPTPHISERNHYNHRPARLNLFANHLNAGSSFGNPPFQGTLGGSPPYYQPDPGCTALMSPTSPNSTSSGGIFNFPSMPQAAAAAMSNERAFDFPLPQGSYFETTVNDDSAFEGPPTPPDSDRESMTGSPPEKQRLPIFRCLSQS